jgi:hypothetical protein
MKYFEIQQVMIEGEKIPVVCIESHMKDFAPKIEVVSGKPLVYQPKRKEMIDEQNNMIFFGPTSMPDEELMEITKEIIPIIKSKDTKWTYMDALRTLKRPDGPQFKQTPEQK